MKKGKLLWLDFLAKIKAEKWLRKAIKNMPKEDSVELFNSKHADILVKSAVKLDLLSEQALLKVFDLPNAKEILMTYVSHRQNLLPLPILEKLFSTSGMEDVMRIYVRSRDLPEAAELKMLSLPNAKELALLYINNSFVRIYIVSPAAQLKMLELANNAEILEAFVKKDCLTNEAEVKMFEQANAIELVKVYITCYGLCEEAELKMLELPEPARTELLHEYLKHYTFAPKAEAKAFEIFNQEDLTNYILTGDGLNEENEPLILDLPNGVELMKRYVEHQEVEKETIEAIFNHPEAAKILPTLVHQPLDLEHEKRLFTMPNAAELLLTYIENNELEPETQVMLLTSDLPHIEKVALLEAYAVTHEFSLSLRQRLAINNLLH